MAFGMAQIHCCTQFFQTLRDGIVSQVRTTHLITQVEQHFSNPVHAGATDADEMDVFDFMSHMTPVKREM